MILITGAAGKTGKSIISKLVSKKQWIRAIVHRDEQALILNEMGVQEVILGDLKDETTLQKAVDNIISVYHICPNMNPNELDIGKTLIKVCQKAKVTHLVYHSVLHPHAESMPHHWQKMRVEEAIFESGLNFTILQPTAYMQNILAYWKKIVNEGIYQVPYPPETRLGLVDLENVAEVAARIITESGHGGAIYELVGTPPLTQTEVASILSQKLGRQILACQQPLKEWEELARKNNLPSYAIDTLLKMFKYYENFGLWGNSNILQQLLGRAPTSFEEFVEREIDQGTLKG